ncbi:hypothetical protein ATANTOWER_005129 [Ataeniobius toweri]|uniref:Uncharacterized protein n=1 Tax=Ataeniobius toweri TaxID=208326 RepID=A0ABU7CF86_9TELE|nr:hypothetical protein [Ataeniobius toweri]
MHLFNRHELLNVFFHQIWGCSENIWSFSPRGPGDGSNKAPGYHCNSKLVYMRRHSVCLRVQACESGIEKTNLTIHIQCLAKVFGPLELFNLLPHFRLQT